MGLYGIVCLFISSYGETLEKVIPQGFLEHFSHFFFFIIIINSKWKAHSSKLNLDLGECPKLSNIGPLK
jgi:hypothetical protein